MFLSSQIIRLASQMESPRHCAIRGLEKQIRNAVGQARRAPAASTARASEQQKRLNYSHTALFARYFHRRGIPASLIHKNPVSRR